MRKVILYIAMSLDGFIADPEGGVSWLEGEQPDFDGGNGYLDFIKEIDTVIMGMKTYHQIVTELSPDRWVYQGMQSYVLTHHPQQNTEEIKFTAEPAACLVERLKMQGGKGIWICGGADLVNQLVKADAIDEYHFTLIPTLLGRGIRLFDGSNEALPLHFAESSSENGMLDCVYTRR